MYFFLQHQSHKKQKKKHSSKEKKGKSEQKKSQDVDLLKVDDIEIKEEETIVKEKSIESKKSKRKKVKNSLKEKENDENHEKVNKKSKKIKSKMNKENNDYEETAGISTPSKEILPSSDLNFDIKNNFSQTTNSYKELSQDKTVKVLYEIKQLEHDTSKIILLISFINKSENVIKELVFNVLDTSTLQLERRVGV